MTTLRNGGGDALAPLARMVYPGRVLIVGRTPSGWHNVIAYALTGRSPSSQARRIVRDAEDPGRFRTVHTDPSAMAGGNPALLYYDCIRRAWDDVYVVSNGAQTSPIAQLARASSELRNPLTDLAQVMAEPHIVDGYQRGEQIDLTLYEPDAPHFTPRISALLHDQMAAMHICRRAPVTGEIDGEAAAERHFFSAPLEAGKGWMLTTYAGPSVPGEPLPSFAGSPAVVEIVDDSAQGLATSVYEALAPDDGAPDLRVAVVAMTIDYQSQSDDAFDVHIINRHEELR